MKRLIPLAFIILTLGIWSDTIYAQYASTVSFETGDMEKSKFLKDVLTELESKYQVSILYNSELVVLWWKNHPPMWCF